MLKKEYQDQRRTRNPRLVGGRAWYNLQAFRAVNQAVGRQERDAECLEDKHNVWCNSSSLESTGSLCSWKQSIACLVLVLYLEYVQNDYQFRRSFEVSTFFSTPKSPEIDIVNGCIPSCALSACFLKVYPAPKRFRRYRALRPAVWVLRRDNRQPQQVGSIEREAVQKRGSLAPAGGLLLSIASTTGRTEPGAARSRGATGRPFPRWMPRPWRRPGRGLRRSRPGAGHTRCKQSGERITRTRARATVAFAGETYRNKL